MTHLRSKDFIAHAKEIVSNARDKVDQVTPFTILLVFQRFIGLQSSEDSSAEASCFDMLLELLELLKDNDRQLFQEAKLALGQIFCSCVSSDNRHANYLQR